MYLAVLIYFGRFFCWWLAAQESTDAPTTRVFIFLMTDCSFVSFYPSVMLEAAPDTEAKRGLSQRLVSQSTALSEEKTTQIYVYTCICIWTFLAFRSYSSETKQNIASLSTFNQALAKKSLELRLIWWRRGCSPAADAAALERTGSPAAPAFAPGGAWGSLGWSVSAPGAAHRTKGSRWGEWR